MTISKLEWNLKEKLSVPPLLSTYLHTYLKQLDYKSSFVFNRPNYSQFSYFLCQRLRSFKSSHISIEKSIMEWIFCFHCYCHGLQNLHFRYVSLFDLSFYILIYRWPLNLLFWIHIFKSSSIQVCMHLFRYKYKELFRSLSHEVCRIMFL